MVHKIRYVMWQMNKTASFHIADVVVPSG
jgi:hypothetical protein